MFIVLYCIVLFGLGSCCIVLYCVVLHWVGFHCVVLYCMSYLLDCFVFVAVAYYGVVLLLFRCVMLYCIGLVCFVDIAYYGVYCSLVFYLLCFVCAGFVGSCNA